MPPLPAALLRVCLVLLLSAGVLASPARADVVRVDPDPVRVPETASSGTRAAKANGLRTGTARFSTRSAALAAYRNQLVPALAVAPAFSGNVAACNAGTPSAATQTSTLQAVNYFRTAAGLGTVTLNSTLNARAQQAALMMSANSALSHDPPSSWRCYTTTGADAAGRSNLALGAGGARSIDLYVDDRAVPSLGHRRWILHPPLTVMGTGSTTNSNALYVINDEVFDPPPAGTPDYLPWPAPGYVPLQIVPNQWSFSSARGMDLSDAVIAVRKNGTALSVNRFPLGNGYGPNTIGFTFNPGYAGGGADQAYEISVSGIRTAGGAAQPTFRYTTTLFDAEHTPPNTQTISFPQPAATTYGDSDLLDATASSGLDVGYTSSTPTVCTVAGRTVTAIDVGTCTVVANQNGNGTYQAAPAVSRSFAVGKATLTVTANATAYAGTVGNLAAAYSGFVRGETLASSDVEGDPGCAADVTDTSPSGSYPVTCRTTGLTSDHYRFAAAQGTLQLRAGLIAVAPTRLVDTRAGQGVAAGRVPGRGSITFVAAGANGVPRTAAAVAINVTSVKPEGGGYLTAYPAGTTRPTVSTLNLEANQNVGNVTLVRPAADGRVTIYNGSGGELDIVVDLQGFVAGRSTSRPGDLVPLAGARLLDSRQVGGDLAPGETRTVQVTGLAGVPDEAASVLVNLTAVTPARNGYVRAYPAGTPRPTTSSLNYTASVTRGNLVSVPVGEGGQIEITNSGGPVDLVIDVTGYTVSGSPSTAGQVGAVSPARVLDTRDSVSVPARGSVTVRLRGVADVPDDATAAIVTLTAVGPDRSGFLTAYPAGTALPTTANVNFVAGRNTAGFAIARLGTDGDVVIYNGSDAVTDVVVDVSGYVAG